MCQEIAARTHRPQLRECNYVTEERRHYFIFCDYEIAISMVML